MSVDDPAADAAEQVESLARIEQGGISVAAERRLSELRERGGSFTSDLSVNGFALCDKLGLRPLSQVMGSSIYQMGYQSSGQLGSLGPLGSRGPLGFGGTLMVELETLSQGLNEVRSRALGRLAEEARHVGADAVVGVSTRAGESDLETGSVALEHVVVGTAVRREGSNGSQPVLTELSVADFAKLVQAGFEPLGIVAWSSVYFASYAFGAPMGLSIGRQPDGASADLRAAGVHTGILRGAGDGHGAALQASHVAGRIWGGWREDRTQRRAADDGRRRGSSRARGADGDVQRRRHRDRRARELAPAPT